MQIVRQCLLAFMALGFALVGLAVLSTSARAADVALQDLRIVASVFPPYSYDQNNHAEGIAVTIVRNAFKRLNVNPNIEVYPWGRALETVQATPNSMLFSMARTPEREDKFKWVGTVIDFDVDIYKKASRTDIHIEDSTDLARYTFAGLLKDVKTQFLKDQGAFVHEVSNEENTFKMLDLGRVDLVASDRNAAEFRMKKLGLNPQDFVSVYHIESMSKPLYLVANINTDDDLVEKVRHALSLAAAQD